jgi:hypothetical protein
VVIDYNFSGVVDVADCVFRSTWRVSKLNNAQHGSTIQYAMQVGDLQ